MLRCGFALANTPKVGDLAAGNGRLIEGIAPHSQLVLNEVDAALIPELQAKFPSPHAIYNADLRRFRGFKGLPPLDALVGSPPWIKTEDGEYLPQVYLDLATDLVRPGGLVGMVLPHWFSPVASKLTQLSIVNPSPQKLRGWTFPERPVVHIYSVPAVRKPTARIKARPLVRRKV